jgi:predicted DNA-binding transcriptional regulator AlpA
MGLTLIRYSGLAAKGINYSRQQIRRKTKAGTFPHPIPLDDREKYATIAWLEHEIDEWIERRAALRDKAALPHDTGGDTSPLPGRLSDVECGSVRAAAPRPRPPRSATGPPESAVAAQD